MAEAYTNIKSFVFINGLRSNPFYIRNGVRQGGVLSSLLFLIFIDSLLKELETSSLETAICDINAGNPTLADDISLIAMTPVNLQKMIEIAQNYVKKWLLQKSYSKSFVMLMTASKRNASQHFTWKINSQPLKVVKAARHVGILMSSNFKSRYCNCRCMSKKESSLSFYFWVCFQNPDINKPVFQSQTVLFCSSTSLLIWL